MSLKRACLFSVLKMNDLLHTGPKLELKKGTLLARVNEKGHFSCCLTRRGDKRPLC